MEWYKLVPVFAFKHLTNIITNKKFISVVFFSKCTSFSFILSRFFDRLNLSSFGLQNFILCQDVFKIANK